MKILTHVIPLSITIPRLQRKMVLKQTFVDFQNNEVYIETKIRPKSDAYCDTDNGIDEHAKITHSTPNVKILTHNHLKVLIKQFHRNKRSKAKVKYLERLSTD